MIKNAVVILNYKMYCGIVGSFRLKVEKRKRPFSTLN